MPTSPLDRRGFLRRTWQVGAVVVGAVATGLAIDDTRTTHRRAPTTTTRQESPANDSQWRALDAALGGHLIRPSSPTYAEDRLLYNTKFTKLHPQAIAYCASADDVARCLEFATRHDVAVCSRSGGHSYGGYSNSDGLVIDVSPLSAIAVYSVANTATVGAGARLIDVYNVVGRHDRLLPGGSCPTVGVAGLALGGGVGVFGRKYGLTSDNLQSVKIVTADSTHVTASAHEHSDLLWASQGGGGGNFGVATSFEFTVHPMPQVTLFNVQFPWAASGALLSGWLRWIAAMPDELWSDCQLLSQGTAGLLAQVSGVYCGDPRAVTTLLAQLTSEIGVAPSHSFHGSDAYIAAMMIEAGCSGLSVASCHLSTQRRAGTRSREAYSAKSSYVDRPMSEADASAMVHAVEYLASLAPLVGGGLAFDAYGGAINRVASGDTAFVHRDKLAGIQATYSWSSFASPHEIAAGQRWLAWLDHNVFTPSTGAYQNYIDPTLAQWATAYYGDNLARLVRVKNRYDSQNLFTFAQSIPLHV
jgi:hypothetical protein